MLGRFKFWKKKSIPTCEHRIECGELNNLHHHGRHTLIALRMQHKRFGNSLSETTAIYISMGRTLDRLEQALREKESN